MEFFFICIAVCYTCKVDNLSECPCQKHLCFIVEGLLNYLKKNDDDNKNACKIKEAQIQTLVEFTYYYHNVLGSDSHVNRIDLLNQYAIGPDIDNRTAF